jgi:hypothetical protein
MVDWRREKVGKTADWTLVFHYIVPYIQYLPHSLL